MANETKAKEKTVISVGEAQRRLFEIERAYGAGAEVTVDEDFNVEPYNRPDLAEETPEESAKRAERQQKEILDNYEEKAEAPRLTRPIEALKAELQEEPVKETRAKAEPTKDEPKRQA